MGKSKYNPATDYLKLANEYLSTCGRENTKLPKISEFCREYIKSDEETVVQRWLEGKQLPKGQNVDGLRGAIKKVKDFQKEQLMDDGLYGGKEVNNAMAIFLLKANHGMIETERKEFVGKDGGAIGVVILPNLNEKKESK